MEFIDDRRLAYTGIPGNEHQFGPSANYATVEGGEERFDLRFSPVQLLGDQQRVRYVMLANREFADAVPRFPLLKTAPQLTLQACCCLVSVFSGFGEQLHDDGRNRSGNVLQPFDWRGRLLVNVAVAPLHPIQSR